MQHNWHFKKSLERLAKSDPTSGLFSQKRQLIEEIVHKVHSTFDEHFVYRRDSWKMLHHRAYSHHEEGIKEITEKLVKEYGEIYKPIIEQEAREHVKDDMGYIPRREEYSEKNFWQNWSERNETLPNV